MSLLDLAGKKGLVVGIANEHSIAYGCAKAFHAAGADVAITYLNARAEPYVRPLAEKLASPIIVPCDVRTSTRCSLPHETGGPEAAATRSQPAARLRPGERPRAGDARAPDRTRGTRHHNSRRINVDRGGAVRSEQ